MHERRFALHAGGLVVEDRLGGPYAAVTLRWRLLPAAWRLTADGAAAPGIRIAVTADGPCRLRLARGWESPAYGEVVPVPVLEATAAAPVARLTTRVEVG
jgi:hypothetical protein